MKICTGKKEKEKEKQTRIEKFENWRRMERRCGQE
jgi:hypothetical protein